MQMIRTFNAVGQGGFCTECFEGGCNVVYDCGTLSDIRCLRQEIDSQFGQDDRIEAVFISHLHADHCNGLEYLLDRCHIRKIFIPFLCGADKILALLETGLREGCESFLWEFIEDAGRAVRSKDRETKIVYVLPGNDENDRDIPLGPQQEAIESGTQITLEYRHSWIYAPFHFRERILTERLMRALTEAGIPIPQDGGAVKRLLENADMRKKLEQIYASKAAGSHNTHTMALYSGPANIVEDSDTWAYRWTAEYDYPSACFCEWREELEAGCLYTGDYQAKDEHKWDALWRFVKPYRRRIGCCQLPHHGAAGSYHRGFRDICEEFVIACGYKNPYHHPGSSVIRELLFDQKTISIVTEMAGSRVTYMVDGVNRW